MHKQREEDRISGALKKPSAEDEFDSRVRESEVSEGRVKRVRLINVTSSTTSSWARLGWNAFIPSLSVQRTYAGVRSLSG